jgi:predicted nucleic acid-binding protein
VAYLDSSALVKVVLQEPGHQELRSFLGTIPDRATSVVSGIEVPRAVARALASVPPSVAALSERTVVIALDRAIVVRAAALRPLTLRSLDAIHIASAMELGPDLASFVTYDQRQAAAAREVGLPVESPGGAADVDPLDALDRPDTQGDPEPEPGRKSDVRAEA